MSFVTITILASYFAGVIGSLPLVTDSNLHLSSSTIDHKTSRKHKSTSTRTTTTTLSTFVEPATTEALGVTTTYLYEPIASSPTTETLETTTTQSATTKLVTVTQLQAAKTTSVVAQQTELPPPVLDTCYNYTGGDGQGGAGGLASCGGAFTLIEWCYGTQFPFHDLYNSTQNEAFRSCVCQSDSTQPFNESSKFYIFWGACLWCMSSVENSSLTVTTNDTGLVSTFCRAEEPDAYLWVSQLASFFSSVDASTSIAVTPLANVTPVVTQMSDQYTTTPPLANLAWGTDAPSSGSLRNSEPVLTTFTRSGDAVTSLVRWDPISGYTAAPTESIVPSGSLSGGPGEGNDPSRCYGRGPCKNSGKQIRPTGVGHAMGIGIGVAFLMELL